MNARELNKEIKKAVRHLPANLDEVEVLISKNNKGITFYYINEERILYKFTIQDWLIWKGGLRMEITWEDYDELIENLGYGDYIESW